MIYYGTRLSENISRREPEGYLLCLNVPVARTGYQDYLPEELGLPRSRADPSGMISVYRPEEEVFSPATVASFEGMPVTNDHPPDGVDLENVRRLSRGHVQNVRRGQGEESDLLLADLMIQDPALISAILNEGKREISCGYLYELSEENGQFVQRNIRGNHVAVVDAGRAGHRVSIRDQRPLIDQNSSGIQRPSEAFPHRMAFSSKIERSPFAMKKKMYAMLARMARDGDAEAAEALAEALPEVIESLTEPGAAEGVAVTAVPAVAGAEPGAVVPVAAAAPAVSIAAPVAAAPALDPFSPLLRLAAISTTLRAAMETTPAAAPLIKSRLLISFLSFAISITPCL